MLVLSFSGAGENSLTLKSLEVLEHHKDVETFEKIIIKPSFDYEKKFDDVIRAMQQADAIIWAVSPFHMNIQSHMLRFFEEMRKRGIVLHNVNTFFQTNMRVCDHFLSATLERQIKSVSKHYVPGLSFSTSDMINQKMSLYIISTPDAPPKRSLFQKTPSFSEGEGLKTAVRWYKVIRTLADDLKNPVQFTVSRAMKVLFVDMEENSDAHAPYVLQRVEELKKFYKEASCTVQDVAQRDYEVKSCDGCKLCYASKECKFKDDFLKYEEQIQRADIVIYYGNCSYGFISDLGKRMLDRGVHNGLMPVDGKLPCEHETFPAVGYVLDADGESYAAFKEYAFACASFGFSHFLGILADIPTQGAGDFDIMTKYALLVTKEKMNPQRNFYTEKVGKHFSDLSQNIPMVIPEEAKYYRKAGGYEPIPVDSNARTIMPDTYSIGVKMRQVPFDKVMEALDKI